MTPVTAGVKGGGDRGWEVPVGPPGARHSAVLFGRESMKDGAGNADVWFDISRDSCIRERKIKIEK